MSGPRIAPERPIALTCFSLPQGVFKPWIWGREFYSTEASAGQAATIPGWFSLSPSSLSPILPLILRAFLRSLSCLRAGGRASDAAIAQRSSCEEPLPEVGRVGGQGAGSLLRWEVVVISLNGEGRVVHSAG